MTMLITVLLAISFKTMLMAQEPVPVKHPSLAITHVTVIDVSSGAVQTDMTVVVAGNRIAELGKSATVPKNARVVDGRGKFLIPGLWDLHVHLSWTTEIALPVLVANGVTSVRDMGGRLGELDAWRTKIEAGLLVGPRIVRVGPILNGRSFNPLQMVPGNPDETRGVVRALKFVGVDFIKVHRRLPRDSYFALIDEAKKQGLTVVGHIPMTVTPEEASESGQATIEHTETLFEGTFSTGLIDSQLPDAIKKFRADGAGKLFARFVKNHTVVTPTLVAYRSIIQSADTSTFQDPRFRYVAFSLKKQFQQQVKPLPDSELTVIKQTFAEFLEVVRQMNRSGVTLMAGSDIAGPRVPGFTLHDELALMVEAGLTPVQALRAATLTPAEVLHKVNDLGSIEGGKIADLLLLDANPLEDIHNTQRISAVVLNGRFFDRKALDSLLSETEVSAKLK